ncbi:MAG: class I SAM-dependent methyltransferase [Gammaproteobacteria bacterium]|nr:class I SAM-dependent methyltransferase [Gammaproteobacteria bacterium]
MDSSDQDTHTCRLCNTGNAKPFHQDKRRDYFQCRKCKLVFVPESQLLPLAEEKSRYDLHQNSPDDSGYCRFLGRLVDPMATLLPRNSSGLDFGCGPGPALSILFQERGHHVTNYDPLYANDGSVFEQQYDFICATEVVEHLHYPGKELGRLWLCLKPGGMFGIMTKHVIDADAFANWHYKNDDTHVCFLSEQTFQWLTRKWAADLSIISNDIVIIQK